MKMIYGKLPKTASLPVTRVGFLQGDDSRLLKAVLSPEQLKNHNTTVAMFKQ